MSASTLTTSLTGNNNDLDFTALDDGVEFNALSIEYDDPGAASQPLAVTFDGLQIKVSLATDSGSSITSTAASISSAICGSKAANTLTSADGGAFDDGDTIVIGGTTYTFMGTLDSSGTVPYQVHAVTDGDTSLGNLVKAINGTGTSGTDWGAGTLPHAHVTAATVGSHATVVTAKAPGAQYNSIVVGGVFGAKITGWPASSVALGDANATSIGADSIDSALDNQSGAAKNNPRRTMYLIKAANHSGNDGTGVVTAMAQAFFSGSTLQPVTGYSTVAVAQAAGWVFLGDSTTGKVTMPTPQNLHNSEVDIWQAFQVSKEIRSSCQSAPSAAALLIACKLYAAQCARKGSPILIKPWLDPALVTK